MRAAILVFPGSNCDRDVQHVLSDVLGFCVERVWHERGVPSGTDAVILPGGFSYGDRLRAGAIAAHSPAVRDVAELAKSGTPILGICNGFQILVEAGLLPGALLRNDGLSFICRWTGVTVESQDTPFTRLLSRGEEIPIPVANGEGRYYADAETLRGLERNSQVVFRYSEDVNGSTARIAGVCSRGRNVVGMMPHPERASEPETDRHGGGAASAIFRSLLAGAGAAA
ncbi:MAG: phosphoribosylformylglycinamidine synthase subunit PurQ [Thaumarchaeota archaeon]|nr:phosphoribosylformylglycinamidine synthase subunit PurQ [Nitrososphaerota archaeon]MDD9825666.1 phosphoribosylformylglycinamidine synthase subunit PurQ [Nitrososphaerota archaeon]MDD9843400.1 phosphoribosylformylglycinamidine synthase subunit PurQ [Nitrososphaerota archaeon]